MNPINPWLDPIEVRRLAERLMRPAANPEFSIKDAGFDAGFIGYATERQTIAPAQATVLPSLASPPPAQTQQGQAPEVRQFETTVAEDKPVELSETHTLSARGPFLERIRRFSDWMIQQFGASGLFILDREGSVIFDESHHSRLHFLARSLALASRRPGTSSKNVHVKIGAGATLEVIPVDTAYGCLILGVVLPDSLAPAGVSAVMEALSQVATPPDSQ